MGNVGNFRELVDIVADLGRLERGNSKAVAGHLLVRPATMGATPRGAGALASQCKEGILARPAPHGEANAETHIGPQQDHTICSDVDAAIITNEG